MVYSWQWFAALLSHSCLPVQPLVANRINRRPGASLCSGTVPVALLAQNMVEANLPWLQPKDWEFDWTPIIAINPIFSREVIVSKFQMSCSTSSAWASRGRKFQNWNAYSLQSGIIDCAYRVQAGLLCFAATISWLLIPVPSSPFKFGILLISFDLISCRLTWPHLISSNLISCFRNFLHIISSYLIWIHVVTPAPLSWSSWLSFFLLSFSACLISSDVISLNFTLFSSYSCHFFLFKRISWSRCALCCALPSVLFSASFKSSHHLLSSFLSYTYVEIFGLPIESLSLPHETGKLFFFGSRPQEFHQQVAFLRVGDLPKTHFLGDFRQNLKVEDVKMTLSCKTCLNDKFSCETSLKH